MKFETTLCHSTLISMLMMPEKFSRAIASYTCSAPDIDGEGFNGYMEVKATFIVKDLEAFTQLWKEGYVYPSDRATWYHFVRKGLNKITEEDFPHE